MRTELEDQNRNERIADGFAAYVPNTEGLWLFACLETQYQTVPVACVKGARFLNAHTEEWGVIPVGEFCGMLTEPIWRHIA